MLRLLKQNDWKLESESLAAACALALHSLLTQLKEQIKKDSFKTKNAANGVADRPIWGGW